MRFDRRLWLVFLFVGGAGFLFYLFPISAVTESCLLAGSCGLSVIALGLGIRTLHPQPAVAWILVWIGQLFNTIGDVLFALAFYIGDPTVPAEWSSLMYFAGSLCFLGGLIFFFIHYRKLIARDALINGLIVATAQVAVVYILRANPLLEAQQYSQVWLNVYVYPFFILMILITASIFLMTQLGHTWSYRFLFASILFYTVGQYFYGKALVWGGTAVTGYPDFRLVTLTNVVFSLAYLFMGLVLLHPSAKVFTGEIPSRSRRGSRMELLVLGAAFWLIPLIFVFQYSQGQPIDISFVVASMLAIFFLVQVRLWQIFQVLENQNRLLNQQKAQLQHQAYHDSLTGLPNRSFLYAYLGDAVYRARMSGSQGAVFMIDFNQFKHVNDLFGHDQGDQALLEISHQLSSHKRKTDFVARWGGDEFVFVLENLAGREDALAAAQRLNQEVGCTIEQTGQAIHVSISIGICLFPDESDNLDALIRRADQALLHAKTLPEEKISFK